MSGIVGGAGSKSKVIDGPINNKSVLQAYCHITSDTPASGDFDRSMNVTSISYGAHTMNVNFLRKILNPYQTYSVYKWGTGSSHHNCSMDSQHSGVMAYATFLYRLNNNDGSTSVPTSGSLSGACPCVFGDT